MNCVLLPSFAQDLGTKAINTAHWLLCFLNQYQTAARLSLLAHKNRFAMIPKIHHIHHFPMEMLAQSLRSKWIINPLATSCQMQESFIGVPSRVSRRVSIRLVHLRSLQRSLLLSRDHLDRSLRDARGMDAYN